jgi:hypothetical protein
MRVLSRKYFGAGKSADFATRESGMVAGVQLVA